jgi:PAS domain S-box-containing protein
MGTRSPRLEAHGDDFAWSLLEAAPDAMVIVADDGEIAYANDHAIRLFGYEADDLLGRTVEDLLPESMRAAHQAHRRRYRAEPTVRPMGAGLELLARRADGAEVPVEISLSPLRIDGETYAIAAVRDISARVAAEAELQRSRDALREAEQVVAVSSDRERIARDLHDTVIQRLFGEGLNLQAALSGLDDADRTRDRLMATIDGLDETIKELRSAIFSLQGSGRVPGGLRGRILEVTTDAGIGLGFEPRVQFDGPVETMDAAVANQLVPVVREALTNVAKHAGAAQVRVAVHVGDRVTLTITDDGIGVPDQVIGGRGVANMAARAEELGGRLTIGSESGGGARLVWDVPNPG